MPRKQKQQRASGQAAHTSPYALAAGGEGGANDAVSNPMQQLGVAQEDGRARANYNRVEHDEVHEDFPRSEYHDGEGSDEESTTEVGVSKHLSQASTLGVSSSGATDAESDVEMASADVLGPLPSRSKILNRVRFEEGDVYMTPELDIVALELEGANNPMHRKRTLSGSTGAYELPERLRSKSFAQQIFDSEGHIANRVRSYSHAVTSTEQPTGNSKAHVIFLLVDTMIGSGVLNQPQVFAESGVVGALISLSLCGFFVWVGLVLLVECGNACGKFDYSDLAVHTFGFIGEEIVDGLIVLNNFGAVMSYMVIIGGTLSDLFMSWGCTEGGCSVYLTTSLAIVLFSLPVCMMRFFGNMSSISLFAVFVIVLTLFVLVISGPIVGSGILPSAFNPSGAIRKFGSIIFGLTCAPAAFHAYKSMERRSDADWRDVCTGAVGAGALLLGSYGLAGSLSFGPLTDGDVLVNLRGHFADAFKFLFVIHLLLYIPLDFIVLRHSCIRLMGHMDGILPTPQHVAITTGLLLLILFCVLFLRFLGFSLGDSFALLLDITGGVAGSFLNFILPGIMYMKTMPNHSRHSKHAVAVVIFGSLLLLMVPTVTVIFNLG